MNAKRLLPAAVLACLIFACGCATQPLEARSDSRVPLTRSIQTSGTSTIYVAPDEVDVRFTVHTHDMDLAKSKAANDAAAKQVLDLVKSLRVEDRDVQTQAMNAERVYEEMPDKHREFRGYSVKRNYTVKLRDVNQLGPLTDALLTRTDCSMGGYEFGTSKSRAYRDRARKMAIRAAREKAELFATELNCRVGPPSSIAENAFSRGYSNWQSNSANSNNHDEDEQNVLFGDVTATGQIEMTATVGVTFDLVPEK